MSSTSSRDIGLAFMGGFIAALVTVAAVVIAILRRSDVYGLGHWRLNVHMPLSTMWMNLGYWTNTEGKPITLFEDACARLLREMLDVAGLLSAAPQRPLAILDVGFGCGDQTWELVRLTRATERGGIRYVGLTMNQFQADVAARRIYQETLKPGQPPADSFTLLQADAAVPDRWSAPVRKAVESLAENDSMERWFLALDCLYHFSPSRRPILQYAAERLGAGLVAFDLILDEKASRMDTLRVRAVGVMMGCPVRTFLTEDEYTSQLVECGYDRESIIIRDISPHVFPGVVKFLHDQDMALSQYGISLGGYKLAGRLFDWFGRSKVVKASIVVAKAPSAS